MLFSRARQWMVIMDNHYSFTFLSRFIFYFKIVTTNNAVNKKVKSHLNINMNSPGKPTKKEPINSL